MKTKKNWIITIAFLAFVIAFAQVTQVTGKSEQKVDSATVEEFTREQNRKIFEGLQGVHVIVESFDSDDKK